MLLNIYYSIGKDKAKHKYGFLSLGQECTKKMYICVKVSLEEGFIIKRKKFTLMF